MNINFDEFSRSNPSNNNSYFVDINNDFKINEIEKNGTDISALTNRKAIRQSLYNIVFTPRGSMNVLMEFGSRYQQFLGRVRNAANAYALGEAIIRDIKLQERRVANATANVLITNTGYEVYIVYDIPSLEIRSETLNLFINSEHRSIITE